MARKRKGADSWGSDWPHAQSRALTVCGHVRHLRLVLGCFLFWVKIWWIGQQKEQCFCTCRSTKGSLSIYLKFVVLALRKKVPEKYALACIESSLESRLPSPAIERQ